MTVRILVTVSRSWSSWSVMREALTQCHDKEPDAVLVFIHRGSRGATHCAQAAEDAGITVIRYTQGVAA